VAGTGNRLAWLDVLRGLAALAVVFNHFGYFVPSGLNHSVNQLINPGDYGVFVFFLISGYIVPASLERKGSVRTFWISRIFRLYPLYLLAVTLALVLYAVHVGGLRGEDADPETSVLSQMLMMSNVLAGQNLPNVVWSLSYEMIFYLLLTALFMARIHRRSSRYALAFGVAAVALGGLLPQAYLTNNLWSPRLIALGLPAAPRAHPDLPAPALDRASLVLDPGARRRAVPGHLGRDVLGDVPSRGAANAGPRPPAGPPARCPVRSGPLPGPDARPGTCPGTWVRRGRLGRAAASWCRDSTVAYAGPARAARGAAAAAP
jgi:acyltransferase-like protein